MCKPAWVIEECLNTDGFDCCGDENLFPIQCSECGHLCVLCYECDTLYADLKKLSDRDRIVSAPLVCPTCDREFPNNIFRDPSVRPSFKAWHAVGLGALLTIPTADQFKQMIAASGEQIADFLARGQRSTARLHISSFRNLAEALIDAFPNARKVRSDAVEFARSHALQSAIKWHEAFTTPIDRAYAILGITDEQIA